MIHVVAPSMGQKAGIPFYLAMEEWVAHHLPADEYLFSWVVPPSVIMGRNQCAALEADMEYCREHGINIYRRRSGGGCVYADLNNLMISYVTPDTDVTRVFADYTSRIAQALRALGVDAQTSGRNDVTVNGKKVSGNAFYRMPTRSIVHGTMLWRVDEETMRHAITPSRSKLESKQVQSVECRVSGLERELSGMTMHQLASRITDMLCDQQIVMTTDQLEQVAEYQKRYTDLRWTFGRHGLLSDSRSIHLRRSIESVGQLDATLHLADDGSIDDLDITGDYFLLTDLDELTSRVRGAKPCQEAISQALSDIDVAQVVRNLSNDALAQMLGDMGCLKR